MGPLLQDQKDKTSTKFDNKETANILQKQFSSVFTKEPNAEVPVLDKKTEVNLSNINIKEQMIWNEILKLSVSKSCGPDEIHPQILIELIDLVPKPPPPLINNTMDEGYILQDWKMAYVSPRFKKGARDKAENYRPLSLTSNCMQIVCKLMKHFVKNSIMTHMRAENLLSSKQYGFMNGRFTTTQLLSYLDRCIDTIVSGGFVDTIYFDIAKAFDSVPHKRLLCKLKFYGINGKVSWNGLRLS